MNLPSSVRRFPSVSPHRVDERSATRPRGAGASPARYAHGFVYKQDEVTERLAAVEGLLGGGKPAGSGGRAADIEVDPVIRADPHHAIGLFGLRTHEVVFQVWIDIGMKQLGVEIVDAYDAVRALGEGRIGVNDARVRSPGAVVPAAIQLVDDV